MLAVIAALHDPRYLAAFRRLAESAERVGLRLADDGLHCSIVTLFSADVSALIREERPVRVVPWSDVAGIETQEVREHGSATWFLAVARRSSPTPCMIRCASLAVPRDRLVEVVREATAGARGDGVGAAPLPRLLLQARATLPRRLHRPLESG